MFKRRQTMKIWLGAMILTGVLGSVTPGFADSQSSIQQLNAKISQLSAQISSRQKQMADLQNQKASVQDQISQLQVQIQLTDQQVSALSEKLRLLNQQIDQVTSQINQSQKQLNYNQALLQERLKVMYENGNVSYLDVLMNSTDFNDFVDRLQLLTMIVKQDKELLQKVQDLKANLLTQQATLKSQQADQLKAKSQLDAALAIQEGQKQQKIALENQINQNIAMTKQEINQDEQEQNAVDKQLAAAIQAQLAASPSTSSKMQWNPNSKWVWPVPSSHYISSGYGPRDGGFHRGIDIAAPLGTPIVAVADGKVLFAGTAEGFGHWIVIEHSPNLLSVYGHMYANELLVSVGQIVKAGQVIAKVGSDGESTGPHLHFSVSLGISDGDMHYTNPTPYLPGP